MARRMSAWLTVSTASATTSQPTPLIRWITAWTTTRAFSARLDVGDQRLIELDPVERHGPRAARCSNSRCRNRRSRCARRRRAARRSRRASPSLTSIAAVSVNSSSTIDSGTPASAKAWRSLSEEIGALDLARADVEGQPAGEAVAVPFAEQCRDLAHHPVADLGDHPGPLGDRDEAVGHAQAVARVVPAQQRLGADHLAGHQAHLRLEGEHEFAALDRFGQRALGVEIFLVLGRRGRR